MMILTLSYEFFMVCLLQQRLQNIKQSQREFSIEMHFVATAGSNLTPLTLNTSYSLTLVARAACHIELFHEAETRKFNLHFLSKQLSPRLASNLTTGSNRSCTQHQTRADTLTFKKSV